MTNYKDFSGYVLAGGKSSRMEKDKAFLEIGGENFLTRAVKTLSGVCEERVKVVLNQTQTDFIAKIPSGFAHITDVYENRGALGGIHAALADCRTKYALILAVDLPKITVETLEELAEITLASNKFIAVVPRQSDNRLQPLCATYNARYCLPSLENLMAENEFAAACDFLELVAPRFVNQEKLMTDDAVDIFFNVNFPDDYDSLSEKRIV